VEPGQRAVERGARLTQQLLAFARHQNFQPRPISVNALLLDIESLFRISMGGEVRLAFVLGEDLPQCPIDSNEPQAAILNLAANAMDAMPHGGSVAITTETAVVDARADDGERPVPGGPYLSIVETDTGHGMAPEVLERAFDPFLTTKEVGKRTGLGLSRIYGFTRQSGDHVTIESAAGAGTSVRLYLPTTDASAGDPEPQVPVQSRQRAPRARRILVVEDDRDVREPVEVLEGLGYMAVAAESGPLALGLLDGEMAIDVVLSDVLMPDGMSGFQLAREVRDRLPDLAIVLTSGMTGISGATEDSVQA
jgi:CheY-like chemotaxis protein